MSSLEEIREERLKKMGPYPVFVSRSFEITEVLEKFSKFSKAKKQFFLTGRIMAIRSHGGSIFFDIDDGTGSLQAYLKKDEIKGGQFSLFTETIDIGDFVELKGTLFKTKKQEKTMKISKWRIIAKSLRPLPGKWHGLKDVEERFRKRYLDLLMNKEVKERFLLRSKIISEIRNLLDKDGFIEVETPILQNLAGGASAEPFITHYNALDIELNLRIAPELYLKKLLIGGFNKVYEIGRDFRNEGIDATHNPEFTMLELYESYCDAEYLRGFIEKILKEIVKKVCKKKEITYGENKISFAKKFSVISYFDVLKRTALMPEPEKAGREDFSLRAKQFGIKVEDFDTKEKIMDNIFKKICRPKIIQPTFVVDYPVNMLPLAKRKEDNRSLVDVFQLYVGGVELVKAFSELNDPMDQSERFTKQEEERVAGDKEAQSADKDFIEALEYGMPPAAGLGLGIDRLVMLLTNTQNIREVILFPTLRPKT